MEKKTETKIQTKVLKKDELKKEVDIHCACATGDLSEIAEVKPVKKTETKIQKKDHKKDDTKKKSV